MDLYVICSISDRSVYLRNAQSSIAERFSVDISWIFKTDSTEINSSDLMIGDILKYNQYYYAICTPNRIYRTLDKS